MRVGGSRGGWGGSKPLRRCAGVSVSEFDPAKCPRCGQGNECGMAAGSRACWCFESSIAPEVLDRVRCGSEGQACLCRICLSEPHSSMVELAKIHDRIRTWR
ncbi:cysteine-rich CWC family protein [Nitrospira japonica]|uniref:cysteine-rich CWC family protein n=1 Tax=Nitrospira japonica TaxID=1325564 RepID=UPI0009BB2BCB